MPLNAGKTKVMWCQMSKGLVEDSVVYPSDACRNLVRRGGWVGG